MTLTSDALHTGVQTLPVAADAGWLRRYVRALVLADGMALGIGALVSVLARFGTQGPSLRGVSYYAVAGLFAVAWWAVLAVSRCYEPRFLGSGPEEFRRVGNASVRFIAAVALFGYMTQVELARGFVGVLLPVGLGLLLLGRYAGRLALHRRRRAGRCAHRVLVVGSPEPVDDLVRQLRQEPLAGLSVVGACLPGGEGSSGRTSSGVPIVAGLSGVSEALAAVQADTLAVAASPAMTAHALRQLSYELEGTGVDLLVAPALTNISGSRISIRPVAGLPLLHLDQPELVGVRKLAKACFDRSASVLALVLFAPVLLAIAVAVRSTSAGPAIFRQQRVGRDGQVFTLYKFRSMTQDAEAGRRRIGDLNDHDGILFKMRRDPRVTGLGAFLRRYSLDELPQLLNVARGQMSLVGPRPPLPAEVAEYETHTNRRLLVKPGMTGLWQISGRSDLSWEDTVRLDLQYVEGWTLGLDLVILAKTVAAVINGRGAY